MKKLVCLLLVVSFLIVAVPATFGYTISQTQLFNGIPNFSGSLTFNQFDNHGGIWTLQSIQVSLTLQASGGQLILDNESSLPASGTFQFGAKGNITSTDVALLNSTFQPVPGEVSAIYSQAFSLAANTGDGIGDYDPSPPDGLLYIGGTVNDSESDYVISNKVVWDAGTKGFIGTGTYSINYLVHQWLDLSSTDGVEFAIAPVTASGFATVVYTYEVIPEPATLLLFGLGGLVLRRK